MTAATACPKCGQILPADSPRGLCPSCLMQVALASGETSVHQGPPTEAIAPEAGVRLKYFGDYELLEELARGGMGVVWKARQSSLHREVALKMIRAGALASKDEVTRFLREAEAAANLQHPNIVAIHEVGEHGGQHYFSMDLVHGRDLGDLAKDGPLPPDRAARYVKIVAEAIHFAHQRGTLHRDLKPQNVLIDGADQPRITDFGLAKFMTDDSRLTQSGVVMGSPSYMPPEQASGRHEDIGPASDVYAMGAMLYELLTGRPPFRGTSALATLHDVLEREPTPPSRLDPNVPPDLETICLKCLEKSPSARYATARSLAEELDRFLKGEPIQARSAGMLRKAVSWGRRHPGTLAALAAFFVIALGFGIFYLFEENAFLRAQQVDPTLTRRLGERHDSLQMWTAMNSFAVLGGLYLLLAVLGKARGLSIREWFDPARHLRPLQPLGSRTRNIVLVAGLFFVACGVVVLVKFIQAHVWEGEPLRGNLFQIYGSVYFGLASLVLVARDYRITHYGVASRVLTTEQIKPIRRAMEDFDVIAAIRHYREAVPDASAMEANQYALRLAETMRSQHPGKYTMPPLSLANLNWKVAGIGLSIEVVVFAIVWTMMPPTQPGPFLVQFCYAMLFGMGLMASMRVKGFWKRMLCLVPALVAMAIGEAIFSRANGLPDRFGSAYSSGILFGVFLMAAAFTRRRTKK